MSFLNELWRFMRTRKKFWLLPIFLVLGLFGAVLQGDPSKPGPYAMLLQWLPGNMSRPHFHPNDRFFIVVSGTWWVGSGPEFKPDATVPMPAGSHVIHYAKGVHFDGAKAEPATILVWGEGPATSTPFAPSAPAK